MLQFSLFCVLILEVRVNIVLINSDIPMAIVQSLLISDSHCGPVKAIVNAFSQSKAPLRTRENHGEPLKHLWTTLLRAGPIQTFTSHIEALYDDISREHMVNHHQTYTPLTHSISEEVSYDFDVTSSQNRCQHYCDITLFGCIHRSGPVPEQ